MDLAIEGRCLCGAIVYRADAQPLGSMVCHCRTCRVASAAPLVPWVTFPADKLQFVRGVPARFQSSSAVTRTFCPSCGTPLTYQHDDRPTEIDVTTCSLKDPDAFPPTHHSWTSHDLRWVRAAGQLPMYEQTRRDA